jgi:Uma2 family endonuclease
MGVEEYYIYDPQLNELSGYQRVGNRLRVIEEMNGWVSPRLGIRFELTNDELLVYYPNGERFKSTVELAQESRTRTTAGGTISSIFTQSRH